MSGYVRVRVGGGQFALPVEHVREIARLGEVAPLPGAGSAVVGVRNLRGQVLPVFDLAALLGLDARAEPASRIVVCEDGGQRAGLAIVEVSDVSALPAADAGTAAGLLAGTAVTEDGEVGVIDVPLLFDALREGVTL